MANSGQFKKGHKGGPGNPHAAQVAKLRSALLSAVTPEKMKAIVDSMIEQAVDGNAIAAKEIFQRTFGPAIAIDLIERLEAVEKAQAEADKNKGAG